MEALAEQELLEAFNSERSLIPISNSPKNAVDAAIFSSKVSPRSHTRTRTANKLSPAVKSPAVGRNNSSIMDFTSHLSDLLGDKQKSTTADDAKQVENYSPVKSILQDESLLIIMSPSSNDDEKSMDIEDSSLIVKVVRG